MESSKKLRSAKTGPKSKGDSRQAEKSLMTRTSILEATLQCLVNIGYAQTTTEKIAKQAGVSRGAMTHHFKSRAEVFYAAAKYVTEKRAVEYDRQIAGVRVLPGSLPTLQDMRDTMVALQKYYATPSFIALNELLRGARTDADLKRTMVPLEKSLDKKISESMLKRFPYLSAVEDTREMLMDLILSSLQGIALDLAPQLKGNRLQRLLDLLASVAMQEFTNAYNAVASPNRAAATTQQTT